METVLSPSRSGATRAERSIWRRCLAFCNRFKRSAGAASDPASLLPTYEATDRELQQLAHPVFRERIDQVRTEAYTKFVTGG